MPEEIVDALVVVIDPGHGGEVAAGGSSPNRARGPDGTLEKDLALDVARRLQRSLEDRATRVLLTRDSDQNLTLGSRAEVARGHVAHAFLSLHFGASADPSWQGTTTCIHERANAASQALGQAVHSALLEVTGHRDLGLQAGPLAVLNPSHHDRETASCLIEPCVLTDPEEERRLADPDYRERLAGALGRAVQGWLRARYPDEHAIRAPISTIDHAAPSKRAVVVGIDDYTGLGPGLDLRFACRDAREVAQALTRSFRFAPDDVLLLLNGDAERDAVIEVVRALAQRGGPDDVLALYFAGRGAPGADGEPRLICADGAALSREDLAAALEDTPTRSITAIADVGLGDGPAAPGDRSLPTLARSPEALSDAPREPSAPAPPAPGAHPSILVRFLCAASPGGRAFEHDGAGHGLFTSALLERLRHPDVEISERGLLAQLALDVEEQLLRCGITEVQRPWRAPTSDLMLLAAPDAPLPEPLAPLHHAVPLVPQLNGMSCWAAAAAMIVGWRDRAALNDRDLSPGGEGWDAYSRGLRPRDVQSLAETWGLTIEAPRLYAVPELYALLQSNGPLWVGEADPDLHVVTLVGMKGDGTVDGTEVEVNDPWPVGRGERYTLTFRELMDNFHAARQLVGLHAQVLHVGGRGGA